MENKVKKPQKRAKWMLKSIVLCRKSITKAFLEKRAPLQISHLKGFKIKHTHFILLTNIVSKTRKFFTFRGAKVLQKYESGKSM